MSKTQRPVKHTPGPWSLDPRSPGDVETPAGVQIAFGLAASQVGEEWHIKGPCPPDDEAEANARLIAASPDLLEALRGLLEAYLVHEGHSYCDLGTDDDAVSRARTAIAKATGSDFVCVSTHMSLGLGIDLPCVEVDKIADDILALDREGVARYVFERIMAAPDNERKPPWVERGNSFKQDEARAHADAILAMVGGGVPAGYKLVPVEPTEAMLRAWLAEEYRQCTGPTPDPAKCYAAMLSALEG
jgi:hypothetical protein